MDLFLATESYLGEGNYLASSVASTLDIADTVIKLMKSQYILTDWEENIKKCIPILLLCFSLRITYFLLPTMKTN